MNQFIELKIPIIKKQGDPPIITKRLVNISEIKHIINGAGGTAIVCAYDYPKSGMDRDRKLHYYDTDSDYNELRKDLTGKSIIDPDFAIKAVNKPVKLIDE